MADDDIISFSLTDSAPVNPLWVDPHWQMAMEILMQEGSFSKPSDPDPFPFSKVLDAICFLLFSYYDFSADRFIMDYLIYFWKVFVAENCSYFCTMTFPQTDLSWTI